MNEIEKQILKNQASIMLAVIDTGTFDNETVKSINDRMKETYDLLNPPKQETIAERTHDAFSQSSEVKE